MAWGDGGDRDVFDFERLIGGVKDGGFHLETPRGDKFPTIIFDAGGWMRLVGGFDPRILRAKQK